jgi:hypothetical protein
MRSWVELLRGSPLGLRTGEVLRAAVQLSPAGSMLGTVVGQVVGGVVGGGAIGGAIAGAAQGGVSGAAQGKARPPGTKAEAETFPRGQIVLALTDQRYLLLSITMGGELTLRPKQVTVLGEKDLGWIADIAIRRKALSRSVSITFWDGSSVRVEYPGVVNRPGLDEFAQGAHRAKQTWERSAQGR